MTECGGVKRILSIEGGGMKGIIPVSVLEYFEENLQIRIGDYFDLFAGTSTGGIIAAGLAAGMPAREIRAFYELEGPKIFRQKWWHPRSLRGIFGAVYNPKHLHKVVQELLGDRTLESLSTRLIVPTVTTQGKIVVFKTPHLPDHYLDGRKSLAEVVLSAVSAPLYFPAHQGSDGIAYTDGGLFANNPIICALKEALKYLDWTPEQMRIMNLGCGDEPLSVANNMGLLKAGTDVVPLIMNAQMADANTNAELLMGEHRHHIHTISPDVNLGRFATDSVKPEQILAMRNIAADRARAVVREIKPVFFDEKAEEFCCEGKKSPA